MLFRGDCIAMSSMSMILSSGTGSKWALVGFCLLLAFGVVGFFVVVVLVDGGFVELALVCCLIVALALFGLSLSSGGGFGPESVGG